MKNMKNKSGLKNLKPEYLLLKHLKYSVFVDSAPWFSANNNIKKSESFKLSSIFAEN